jgi:acyl dehydratase
VASNADAAFELIKANLGRSKGSTDWFEVTQAVVDQYADVTRDRDASFLAMALLSHFNLSLAGGEAAVTAFSDAVAGINYGFDNVRFVSPVTVDSRIRATSVIKDVTRKGDAVDEINTITVEIQDEDEPALVADWIIRWVFAPKE